MSTELEPCADIHIDIPDHCVLFSFNNDDNALHFQEWWYTEGRNLYEQWEGMKEE